jgi:hypothetical protein
MKFKSFNIEKICLMIKIKLLTRKYLYYFSPFNTFMGNGKDPDPDPEHCWLAMLSLGV